MKRDATELVQYVTTKIVPDFRNQSFILLCGTTRIEWHNDKNMLVIEQREFDQIEIPLEETVRAQDPIMNR
mgnify:CR=1 FL=1